VAARSLAISLELPEIDSGRDSHLGGYLSSGCDAGACADDHGRRFWDLRRVLFLDQPKPPNLKHSLGYHFLKTEEKMGMSGTGLHERANQPQWHFKQHTRDDTDVTANSGLGR
jgi:hypothetical protein